MTTTAASPEVVPDSVLATRARLQRLAVIGFPLLLIASSVAGGGVSGADTDAYLTSVTGNRTGVLVGSIMSLACVLLFAALAQVISERLAPSMPRLAWYGKLVAWVGMFAGYAINTYGIVDWAATDPSLNRAEMVKFMDILEGAALPAVYQPGILTPLAILALSIGLWRSHVVPTWTAALLVLAAVTFPMGQIGQILAIQIVCGGLFLVAGLGLISAAGSPASRRDTATVSAPKTFVH